MQFIRTTGWEDGIAALTDRLVRELASDKKVLWLVSGGSNVAPSVQVMEKIAPNLTRNLGIMPADERYGPLGHSDSNWTQLLEGGFRTKNAQLWPVLQDNMDFEQTIDYYAKLASDNFANYEVIIAQLGIGEDGHILGILPGSIATERTDKMAVGYERSPYKRLTLTFPALERVSAVYAFAFGAAKQSTLDQLQHQDLPISQQPAQALKNLAEAYLYSDQVEPANG